MATDTKKTRSQPAQHLKAQPRSPVVPWLLGLSLAGNIALAIWAITAAHRPAAVAEPVSSEALHPNASMAASPKSVDTLLSPDLRPYAALGTFLAENNHIPELKWNDAQFDAFQRGVRASYEGHGIPLDDQAAKLRDDISARVQAMIETKGPSDPIEDYFKTLREKEGVKRTSTGLHYRITQEGYGKHPGPDSTVVASYAARLPDGQSIPSLTRTRARSAVRDLLPGLGEGVQMLNPGGKALVYLSPALSFRDGQWPADVPKGAPIIFFLELHAVE